METGNAGRKPIVTLPGEGRHYPMGRIQATFKADNAETGGKFSVSEWWLEPRTLGPHVHAHADDHLWYVIGGILSLTIDGVWLELGPGSYVVLPGGVAHSFENRGTERAGFISINVPGGFETRMADIAPALAAEDLRM